LNRLQSVAVMQAALKARRWPTMVIVFPFL